MLKNYFAVALRNFRKNKLHSVINIVGLALAFATAGMIFLFAHNELTYDAFHENAESIYMVYKERITPTGTQITHDTWVPMAQALRDEYPDIVDAARIYQETEWIKVGNQRFEDEITVTDASIFNVFDFPLQEGDAQMPFSTLNSAVLSSKIARKYFGDSDPIGKTFTVNYRTEYTVQGILAEIPDNSSYKIDIMIPFASLRNYEEMLDNWSGSFLYTFVLLPPQTDPATLEAQFPGFVSKIWSAELNQSMNLKLLPLLDWYNEETDARKYAYILLGIAVMILTIASINFMNLTTARSLERAREIGMRKVLGAVRKQLIGQFLCEAILLSFLALAFAIGLIELSLPYFNSLYELHLQTNYLANLGEFLSLIGLATFIGILSGLYPALIISGFEPAKSLKGELKTSPGSLKLRSNLVVVQFSLAIILTIGTLVMWRQVEHMKNADLNFNREGVLATRVRASDFEDREQAGIRMESFKNELRKHSNIASVASSTHIPGQWSGWFTFAYPTDRDDSQRLRMRFCFIDENFFDTYGIQMVKGRNFSARSGVDEQESIILNEAALRDIGWHDIENRQVRLGDNVYNVIGLVKNYHYDSVASEVAPVVHRHRSGDSNTHRIVSAKLGAGDVAATLDFVRQKWHQLDPARTFDYFFVGDNFERLYDNESRLSTVTSAFTTLAIIIASLGLFALASLIITQKTKEIGVRKTLGASVNNIVLMLSRSFVRLVGIAFIVAVPASYWASDLWLAEFVYRTDLNFWIFAAAGAFTVLVALLAVGYQSIRAAVANPVDALKYE